MKHDIQQLKQALPLDALMRKLGHGELVKAKALCPFHQDKRHSFSVYGNGTGELHWKCFAGCGQGDALDFVKTFFDLPDTKRAIAKYAELAGMGSAAALEAIRLFQGKARPAKVVVEPKPLGPPAKLAPLTLKAAKDIAKWRGLSPAFVQAMSDKGVLGLWDNKPAIKALDGLQVRAPGGSWYYTPGAKTSLLVLGGGLENGDKVAVVESNWDALAFYESENSPVICTRGAANARLAIDYIGHQSGGATMTITIIPHNDKPGEDWANDLRAGLMLHSVQVKRVPAPYKDFAELHKANMGAVVPTKLQK